MKQLGEAIQRHPRVSKVGGIAAVLVGLLVADKLANPPVATDARAVVSPEFAYAGTVAAQAETGMQQLTTEVLIFYAATQKGHEPQLSPEVIPTSGGEARTFGVVVTGVKPSLGLLATTGWYGQSDAAYETTVSFKAPPYTAENVTSVSVRAAAVNEYGAGMVYSYTFGHVAGQNGAEEVVMNSHFSVSPAIPLQGWNDIIRTSYPTHVANLNDTECATPAAVAQATDGALELLAAARAGNAVPAPVVPH